MQLNFAKYEGAGNDFILIDARSTTFMPESKMVARLCDRHFGIGADGLMTLGHSTSGDCSMRYYNADGSVGEMCGNGGRCFTLFAHHQGITNEILCFDALDGSHTARLLQVGPQTGVVELGMIDVHRIDAGDGWWCLNTGVPHYVEFTDNMDQIDVLNLGRTIRYDTERFPQGTNVNFVQVKGEGLIRIRTYERGVEAETLACGTGATAAAIVTAHVLQPAARSFDIDVQGGRLFVTFDHDLQTQNYTNIRLCGDARKVFEGTLNIEIF